MNNILGCMYLFAFVATSLAVVIMVDLMLYINHCSQENSGKCHLLRNLRKVNAAFAPFWQFYYVVAEAIFCLTLVRMLKGINNRDVKFIRYTRFQTYPFFTDIVQFFAFTVYNMSQFGVSIPCVFRELPHDGEIAPDPHQSSQYDTFPAHLSLFNSASPPLTTNSFGYRNRTSPIKPTENFQLSDIRYDTSKLHEFSNKPHYYDNYASGSSNNYYYIESIESSPKAVLKNRDSENDQS
ncbi:8_t:CDS:2 [Ambispora gerdemannii]|uniref:8_t:CDS:1 n=1 Tax=Ambispora gerdemannii TaxID=144530 RepID=A0A9N9G7N9_9GLOM|nr:8_t:CDS:2 [Ambispora gerdemannii]